MAIAEVRRVVRSQDDMTAWWGGPGADEKKTKDEFFEGNDCGAELVFTDTGVAVWLPVGACDGDDYPLTSLGRAEFTYPFLHAELMDALDGLAVMFEAHLALTKTNDDDQHEVTAVAKGLQGLGNDDDDGQVALEHLSDRVTCGKCGRPAPVLLHVIEFTELLRLDVDTYERDTTDLTDGRGEQISLTACCQACDHKWAVKADLGELL
jgi:hypothetical protein